MSIVSMFLLRNKTFKIVTALSVRVLMKYIIYTMISMSVIVCWSAEDQKRGIIHYPSLVTFAHEQGIVSEQFDLSHEDVTQMESIADLIDTQHAKNLAFITARLLTTTGSNKTVSYVGANGLHRLWWFKGHLYPENKSDDGENELVYNRFPSFEIDPSSKMMVRGEVPYFIAKHGGDDAADDNNTINFYYIGSSRDLISKDIRGHYLRALLMAHYGASHENTARQAACHFLTQVYQGKELIPDVKVDRQLAQYYETQSNKDLVPVNLPATPGIWNKFSQVFAGLTRN